jgi:hypothetical protein
MTAKELPQNKIAARIAAVGNMDTFGPDLTNDLSPSQWSGMIIRQSGKCKPFDKLRVPSTVEGAKSRRSVDGCKGM